MNKTFDIKRLGLVMRWDIQSYWVYYLGAAIGNIIAFSLYSLIRLYYVNPMNGDAESIKELYIGREGFYFMATISISFYVMASCIFTNMKTKTSRESFLMIPASNAEKFMARFLQMLICNLLLLVCVLIGTDIIQLAFSFIITPDFHTSISLPVLKLITTEFLLKPDSIAICILIFIHSFATLGGTFYRKMAPLFTFVTGLVLLMVLGYNVKWLGNTNLISLIFDLANSNYISTTTTCIFFLALSAFNYWASYKIFTRMQVICNKWINI